MIDAHDADQVLDVPGKVVQGRLCGLGDEPRDDDDPEKPAAAGDRLRQLIALPAVVVADGLAGGMGDHDRSGRHLEGVPTHLLAAVTHVDENPGRVQAPHHLPAEVREASQIVEGADAVEVVPDRRRVLEVEDDAVPAVAVRPLDLAGIAADDQVPAQRVREGVGPGDRFDGPIERAGAPVGAGERPAGHGHAGPPPEIQVLLPGGRGGLNLLGGERGHVGGDLVASEALPGVLGHRRLHPFRVEESVDHRRLLGVDHQRLMVEPPRLFRGETGFPFRGHAAAPPRCSATPTGASGGADRRRPAPHRPAG